MNDGVKALLERTAAVYAGCASYRDEAEVVTVFVHTTPRPRRRTNAASFRTLFVRPERFRLEIREHTVGPASEWERYQVVRTPAGVRVTWTVSGKDEQVPSLGLALAAAAGASGGAATRMPELLMPEEVRTRRSLWDHAWETERNESVDGEACALLREVNPKHEDMVWIGRETGLIRRWFDRRVFDAEAQERLFAAAMRTGALSGRNMPDVAIHDDYVVERTTAYRPRMNDEISAAEFEIGP